MLTTSPVWQNRRFKVNILMSGRDTNGRQCGMCRNIKTLFNFEPVATDDEIRAASLQFVRKISGFTNPSRANEATFATAVDDIAAIAARLLDTLESNAPPKNREEEAARAKARSSQRFGTNESTTR